MSNRHDKSTSRDFNPLHFEYLNKFQLASHSTTIIPFLVNC